MSGHAPGTECVIVEPITSKCVTDVVTVLGTVEDCPVPGHQEITKPPSLNRFHMFRDVQRFAWRPEWLRPLDQDMDADDGDVVRQMTHKPDLRTPAEPDAKSLHHHESRILLLWDPGTRNISFPSPGPDWSPIAVMHKNVRYVAARNGRVLWYRNVQDPNQW